MKIPLIEFKEYGFQYHAQAEPTLHNINLAIYQGEKILIVGPSGSGKSTLANCINGLIPFNYRGKSTGCVQLAGTNTDELSLFELSKIVGTVLQDPDGQFVGLTVGEDIAFSLENECVPQKEMLPLTEQAAKMVGIENYLDYSPYNLSGGQKQRVSMAGVMVDKVQVLLFDEPLASLDPATGKQAIDLIDQLQKKTDTTVIIIEHRLEDVLYRNVDRVIVMDEGCIVADMPPDQLVCTDLLRSTGIREPLYITLLRYAGVKVTPDKKPGRMDTLTLTKEDIDKVLCWQKETHTKPYQRGIDPLLMVENLGFSYKADKPVLKEVSFTVAKGEMTAIVGTNGAGKSTLAKLICGFEKPGTGNITLNGEDLSGKTIVEHAQSIGYVMQNPNQMISKTMIFDEVALGLRSRQMDEGEIQRKVEETLEICGLFPFRKWPVSALSFGQKKRVTIASVLVMSPEIIILDEPTAGQDFKHYTEIMRFLCKLNHEGYTILMITHDMHLMQEYALRTLVFSEGRLWADTTAAKILTDTKMVEQASLKETSLFNLAQICGISDAAGFVQQFIDYEAEVNTHG